LNGEKGELKRVVVSKKERQIAMPRKKCMENTFY
jgi:hypothetical protein